MAIKDGGRSKVIWELTEKEVFFDGSIMDLVSVGSFWRIFNRIEVDDGLAEKIRREIDADRTATAKLRERRQGERLEAERQRKELQEKAEMARETDRLQRVAEDTRRQLEQEQRLSAIRREHERKIEAQRQEYLANAGPIREVMERRGIRALFHFTRIENLANILQSGLLPRNGLIDGLTNDAHRLDDCLDASSISIGFPNYKLFYRFRQKFVGSHWVVLDIDPAALCVHRCRFNVTNAANAMLAIQTGRRAVAEDLEGMFAMQVPGVDKKAIIERAKLHIPNDWPTDPQAEVLLFGRLHPRYIRRIILEDQKSRDAFEAIVGSRGVLPEVQLDGRLFRPRSDYEFWVKPQQAEELI